MVLQLCSTSGCTSGWFISNVALFRVLRVFLLLDAVINENAKEENGSAKFSCICQPPICALRAFEQEWRNWGWTVLLNGCTIHIAYKICKSCTEQRMYKSLAQILLANPEQQQHQQQQHSCNYLWCKIGTHPCYFFLVHPVLVFKLILITNFPTSHTGTRISHKGTHVSHTHLFHTHFYLTHIYLTQGHTRIFVSGAHPDRVGQTHKHALYMRVYQCI